MNPFTIYWRKSDADKHKLVNMAESLNMDFDTVDVDSIHNGKIPKWLSDTPTIRHVGNIYKGDNAFRFIDLSRRSTVKPVEKYTKS